MNRPSHVAPDGSVAMVDVGAKAVTARAARACALVRLPPAAAAALRDATLPKFHTRTFAAAGYCADDGSCSCAFSG